MGTLMASGETWGYNIFSDTLRLQSWHQKTASKKAIKRDTWQNTLSGFLSDLWTDLDQIADWLRSFINQPGDTLRLQDIDMTSLRSHAFSWRCIFTLFPQVDIAPFNKTDAGNPALLFRYAPHSSGLLFARLYQETFLFFCDVWQWQALL